MASKDLTVRILGDASNFNKALAGIGNSASVTGAKLTKTLTPAAAAVGLAMGKMGSAFNDSRDAIIVGTGASGAALDALMASSKRVAGRVPNDFGQVGQAIADVNTRLGLTGPELETVAKKALDLSRITGTDLSTNIRSAARVTRDWGIDASETGDVMDLMFKASQATGIGFDQLGDKMVQFGVPLRQIGFTLEETVALLAGFEAQGVNTELVMGSLRIALGKMARAGEEPQEAFVRLTDAIKNTADEGEAVAMAMELFGAKAGSDMAGAIREGRFEIDELVASLGNSSGSIDDAADRTLRFSDRMNMLKNRVIGFLGPFGEVGGVAGGVVASLGPLLFGLGAMAPLLVKLKNGFIALKAAMIGHPIMLLATIAVGVGTALAFMSTRGNDATAAIEKLADSMHAANDAGDGLASFLADLANDTPVFSKAMDEAGVTVTQVTEAAMAGGPAWDAMKASLEAAGDAVAENKWEQIGLQGVLDQLPDVVAESTDAMERRGRVDDTAASSASGAAVANEDLAASAEDVAAATDAATDALERSIEATISAIDSSLGYRNQVADTTAAIATATGEMAKHERGTNEYEQAARDAEGAALRQASAAVRLADDTAKANGQTLTATERSAIYRDELSSLAGSLNGSAADAVNGHIARLGSIPRSVSTQVIADVGGASRSLDALIGKLDAIGARSSTAAVVSANRFRQRATGGVVGQNETTLVGEQGPEIAEFPAGTKIHTAGETKRMLSDSGSTPSLVINHYGPNLSAADVARGYKLARLAQ